MLMDRDNKQKVTTTAHTEHRSDELKISRFDPRSHFVKVTFGDQSGECETLINILT